MVEDDHLFSFFFQLYLEESVSNESNLTGQNLNPACNIVGVHQTLPVV